MSQSARWLLLVAVSICLRGIFVDRLLVWGFVAPQISLRLPTFVGPTDAQTQPQHVGPGTSWERIHSSPFMVLYSHREDSPQRQRRVKKNKYAQFSKFANQTEDPMDALIRESERLQKELEADYLAEQQRRKPTPPPPVAIQPKVQALSYPDNRHIDPYDPSTFGYMEIGTVEGAHGVHGWVKVRGETDYPERLTTPGMLLHFKPVRRRAPRRTHLMEGRQIGPDKFLIRLQGIDSREKAKELKQGKIYYATEQDTVRPEQDMLLTDLVGLKVLLFDDTDVDPYHVVAASPVGEVSGVVLAKDIGEHSDLGQDLMEVIINNAGKDYRYGPEKRVLIPIVPSIVVKVDLETKCLWIDPPEGLLDLTFIRQEKVVIAGILPLRRSPRVTENTGSLH